jgi:GT2 family glycosyltransferase
MQTLESISEQKLRPAQIIIVDGSDEVLSTTDEEIKNRNFEIDLQLHRAPTVGAAAQRNWGMQFATQPIIGFFDDDIVLRAECIRKMFDALVSDPSVGAVSASIENQNYRRPTPPFKWFLDRLADNPLPSYQGRVIGPALNFLPEYSPDIETSSVDWLSTTCSLYRRDDMPTPAFPEIFTGYSLMEDVALSIEIGKRRRLLHVPSARIFHDSQPTREKNDPRIRSRMEVINRHFVMTKVMGKTRISDYTKMAIWEYAQTAFCLIHTKNVARTALDFWGRVLGYFEIIQTRSDAVNRGGPREPANDHTRETPH